LIKRLFSDSRDNPEEEEEVDEGFNRYSAFVFIVGHGPTIISALKSQSFGFLHLPVLYTRL